MFRLGEKKQTQQKFYAAKKPKKIWDANADNIVISKLIETKTNSKYLIGYSEKAIRPLILIMPRMSGYVKTFKVKDGDKDKNNKLMLFRKDDEKLLEKYKAIWTKVEDLKNIKLNALPVYDDRYIKTKIKIYGDKIYTNFRGLDVQKMIQNVNLLQSFLLILYLYSTKNITFKVYLDNCAYKIVNNQVTDHLHENLFED